ncbi:MAG: hypothetical protein KBA46_06670 [Candidatus Omnitrophica bacterium]|nr:hypothetical protein [Candidatus Omnitrophota bacterium]
MKRILIVMIAVVCSRGVCFGIEEDQQTQAPDVTITSDSSIRYQPASKAHEMAGDVAITEAQQDFSYEFKAFGKLPIQMSIGSSYVGIDDTVPVFLPTRLTSLTSDFETTFPFFGIKNTYMRIGISPSFFGDNWEFETSSFRIPQRYLVIYRPHEDLIIAGGVIVEPDSDSVVIPALGFIYRPDKRWELYLIPPEPYISYAVTDRAKVFVSAGASLSEYEVDKGEHENIILRYKEIHAGLGTKIKITDSCEASLSSGGQFSRNFKYRDDFGKVNIENGYYVAAALKATF